LHYCERCRKKIDSILVFGLTKVKPKPKH
jgi:hypothetical protein